MSQPTLRTLTVLADGQEIASGCHLRLRGTEDLSLRPAFFILEIEALSSSSAACLSGARTLRVLRGASTLAEGEIDDVVTSLRSGIPWTTVAFAAGLSFWRSSVSLSLPAGLRLSDTLRLLLGAAGRGRTDPAFSLAALIGPDPVFSRPQAFYGRTAELLLALAAGASISLSGSLPSSPGIYRTPAGIVYDGGTETPVPSLTLTESHLLSAPEPTADGLLLHTEMAGWPIGASLRYAAYGQSGTGRILSRSIDADQASGPWLSSLLLSSARS